jgi:hypothetical protein
VLTPVAAVNVFFLKVYLFVVDGNTTSCNYSRTREPIIYPEVVPGFHITTLFLNKAG